MDLHNNKTKDTGQLFFPSLGCIRIIITNSVQQSLSQVQMRDTIWCKSICSPAPGCGVVVRSGCGVTRLRVGVARPPMAPPRWDTSVSTISCSEAMLCFILSISASSMWFCVCTCSIGVCTRTREQKRKEELEHMVRRYVHVSATVYKYVYIELTLSNLRI